jgi:hypothetical protein
MKMNYDVYLFACLLREFSSEFNNRPYDEQYDLAVQQFKVFEKSKYNDVNKGAYECIENYLYATIENSPAIK